MDVFLEYLLEKKSTGKDILIKLGIVLLAVVATYLVVTLFMMLGRFAMGYIPIGIAAVVYGAYIWMRNFNLEYEYIFTNGELDIDKIKSRKVRKRIVSVSCKNIELMASKENDVYKRDFENESITKKYEAVPDPAKGNIYCAIFNKDGERSLLTFQPPKKLAEEMKKYNPRSIFVDQAIEGQTE